MNYLNHTGHVSQAAHTAARSSTRGRNSTDVHDGGCDILVSGLESCPKLAVPGREHITSREKVAIEL